MTANEELRERLSCLSCRLHYRHLQQTKGIQATGMAFVLSAIARNITPGEAVAEYLTAFHNAGHPADNEGMNAPPAIVLAAGESGIEDAHIVDTVMKREGSRVVPHPFVPYDDGAVCDFGADKGAEYFCGGVPGDTIHAFGCPFCEVIGWIWTEDGRPHCGSCHTTMEKFT